MDDHGLAPLRARPPQLRDFAPALCTDETEGYAHLLGLVFDELAYDLPVLFGDVGLTRLFPIPAPTLRAVVDALNDPELEPAWTDDTTLGWSTSSTTTRHRIRGDLLPPGRLPLGARRAFVRPIRQASPGPREHRVRHQQRHDPAAELPHPHRADSVRRYLITQGIDSERLEAKGFGPDRPLVEEVDQAAMQKNRRVEFIIVE